MQNPAVKGFACGDKPWADKVADFLRSGEAWVAHTDKKRKSQTLLYCANGGEGEVIGFANIAARNVGHPLYHGSDRIPCFIINWMAIRTEHQGKGYASDMLDRIVITAIAAGKAGVYLLVDERNVSAKRLYEKKNFVTFADADPYLDEEDDSKNVRMIRPLRDEAVI